MDDRRSTMDEGMDRVKGWTWTRCGHAWPRPPARSTGAAWEELAGSKVFTEYLHREFPQAASEWDAGDVESAGDAASGDGDAASTGDSGSTDGPAAQSRRQFLQLMGASLALSGLSACTRQPTERIAPYVRQPEEMVLGRPLSYATALTLDGLATGVLVTSREGRPIKIEGNPDHPASLGATDLYSQAAILGLYDPHRSRSVTYLGEVRPAEELLASLRGTLDRLGAHRGAGLRVLTGTVTSPTLGQQLRDLLDDLPEARWHQYDPVGRDTVQKGALLAFGESVNTMYRLDRADVILSIDDDFLFAGPGSLPMVRDFARGRRLGGGKTTMNRLYAVECSPDQHGRSGGPPSAPAPERGRGPGPGGVGPGRGGVPARRVPARWRVPARRPHDPFVTAVAADLVGHRGRCVVLPGDYQPRLGPCPVSPVERGARKHRQHRALHRPGGAGAGRSGAGGLLGRAVRRHDRRAGGDVADPRGQPGLRRPRRPRFRGRAAACCHQRPPGALPGRDRPKMPLACAPGPRAGVVWRRPRLRWHGHHPAAAHRAPVRWQVRLRAAGHALRATGEIGLRSGAGSLAAGLGGGGAARLRGQVPSGAPRRPGRRLGPAFAGSDLARRCRPDGDASRGPRDRFGPPGHCAGDRLPPRPHRV